MYRLAAFDLDDTLLDPKMEITPRTIKAIEKAREKGCIITIATGRMFVSTKKYMEQIKAENAIVYNGSMIMDSAGKRLTELRTPYDLACKVLDIAYKEKIHVQVYIDDNCYADHDDKESELYFSQTAYWPISVGDLRKFLRVEPTKLLMIGEVGKIKGLYEELRPRFEGLLDVTITKPYYLEFCNPLATKGNALMTLAGMLGIDPAEVIA
ncbi:MAG TPA: HAD-IIB family hydrolase, partial [Clostridia bacterium]|nr:HAD-IIB family hydrolase [Clostridia bacterium]